MTFGSFSTPGSRIEKKNRLGVGYSPEYPPNSFVTAMHPQLFEDSHEVHMDSVGRDVEAFGDFLVRKLFGQAP
jgi:hypothetical protein